MSIFDKLFQNQITKRVKEEIKKTILFDGKNIGIGTQYTTGKYTQAGKDVKQYADAYSEELYVYGCVWLISNTIASLPFNIFKEKTVNKKTEKETLDNHPAWELLKKPNFKDSQYDLKESISANLEITGNCYLLLDKQDGNGIPEAIYSLNSGNMIINKTDKEKIEKEEDFIKNYTYGNVTYGINQIIHERKFSMQSEYYGMSPIQAGALTIDTAIESKRQNYNIFKQGMNPDGAFKFEQPYNETLAKRTKEDIRQKYEGQTHSHEPLFLWQGTDYKTVGLNPKDIEFIQGLKLSREELCGFLYQVPIILFGIFENATYNNLREALRILYEISIKPRLIKNQELWQKLIDLYGIEGARIEYNLSNVDALKDSLNDKTTRAKDLFSIGVPLNQIIIALDLPFEKIPGGDVGYIPFSLMPIGRSKPEETGEEIPPEEGKKVKAVRIKWDEQRKETKWKNFVSMTDGFERLYVRKMIPFFTEEKKEIIANLEKYKSFSYQKVEGNTFIIIGEIDGIKKAINIESVLFDYKGEVKKFNKINLPLQREIVKKIGQAEWELLELAGAFNIDNPRIIRWLEANSLTKSKEIIDTVREAVKQQIIDGVNEGEGIPKIQDRIADFYEEYEVEGYKLERIARTEVVGASNEGALESYRQSGVDMRKAWLPAYDERTRDTHIQAGIDYSEDKAIPLDENFYVGAGSGPAPGQIGLAEEDINCRCVLLPIIPEETE